MIHLKKILPSTRATTTIRFKLISLHDHRLPRSIISASQQQIQLKDKDTALLNYKFSQCSHFHSTALCYNNLSKSDKCNLELTPNPFIIYEGPFAKLALRLKRISITSAVASIIGVPAIMFWGSNLPLSGQLAVGGTAIMAACGSTLALDFCFSPYIHQLEWIPVRSCLNNNHNNEEKQRTSSSSAAAELPVSSSSTVLLKATTRNIFSFKCETIFDPTSKTSTDIQHLGQFQTYRPFCNFMVKGKPFFIHPELIQDDVLRVQLLGTQLGTLGSLSSIQDASKRKDPDDDFL